MFLKGISRVHPFGNPVYIEFSFICAGFAFRLPSSLGAPTADQLMFDIEVVKDSRDDEVDQITD